jgi:hypothetical protein
MTIAQIEKMEKTNKVMFSREVIFKNYEGNWYMGKVLLVQFQINFAVTMYLNGPPAMGASKG